MDVRFPAYGGTSASGALGSGTAGGVGSLQGPKVGTPASSAEPGFSGVLKTALENVSALHNESATLQSRFQMGAEGASLEQTMIAMQKSQIGFQAALTVRNRLVAAYTDIMNMPV